MTAPLDLDGLEKLSRAATPGPWEHRVHGLYDLIFNGVYWFGAENASCLRVDDAAFIASANPATVLALIARVREAENECADLTTVRNNYRYEHVALKDELTEARARIEALEKVVDAARALVAKHPDDCNHISNIWKALSALDAGEKE